MKYTALGEGLVTNIALGFVSTIFATRLSPRAVYFIQTGGSALSNTYIFTNTRPFEFYTEGIRIKQSFIHKVP